jgi:hypothetical protein
MRLNRVLASRPTYELPWQERSRHRSQKDFDDEARRGNGISEMRSTYYLAPASAR